MRVIVLLTAVTIATATVAVTSSMIADTTIALGAEAHDRPTVVVTPDGKPMLPPNVNRPLDGSRPTTHKVLDTSLAQLLDDGWMIVSGFPEGFVLRSQANPRKWAECEVVGVDFRGPVGSRCYALN